MDIAPTLIPVRSRRQAMDWSLVLASQDIEHAVQPLEDSAGWALAVAPQDYERALEAIRLYCAENRGWPWQRRLRVPEFVFDAGSVAWVLLLAIVYGVTANDPPLRAAGLMDNAAVARGEWWRLFTAVLLHADVGHLASNLALGCVLLGLAMGRFGTGLGLLAAYAAGVFGNGVVWLFCDASHRSLGASGMVLGALGLLAAQSVIAWRHGARTGRGLLGAVAAGVLLFVFLGLTPGTDVVAHAGGFVGGLLIGAILVPWPRLARNGKVNLLAGLAFAALVVATWWLAVR